MNKTELIAAIATKTELTKVDTGKAVDALLEILVDTVAKGDSVSFVGFGTFKPMKRAAREGRNPKTGALLKIAATTVPKFAAGAAFKQKVAAAKSAGKKK